MMNNMNNNMNQMMMNNMNQMMGWNFNMNQANQFNQMINSNPMFLMIYNQMLNNMQNFQNFPNNNPYMGNQNINQNISFNQNNMNNPFKINLNFINNDGRQCIIPTDPNELMSCVINNYIERTGDTNINYYLYNGKRIVQSLTVAEEGLNDGSNIQVINIGNLEGAI